MTLPGFSDVEINGPVVIVDRLVNALQGILDMGPTAKQKGHAPGCGYGMWLRGDCTPDPCSDRCQEAQNAIAQAREWRNP